MQGWSGNTFKYESYWQQKPEEMQCFIYQFKKMNKIYYSILNYSHKNKLETHTKELCTTKSLWEACMHMKHK